MMLPATGDQPVPLPPTDTSLALDRATNLADLARVDVSKVMQALPDKAPLWVSVDLVRAARHLRLASVLIDKSSDALDAEGAQR